MGKPVLADAQFGIARILRPYDNFENDYEGVACTTPIQFTEAGRALDQLAGTAGYAGNLVRGLAVPLGSRLLIYVPGVSVAAAGTPPYNWIFIWRLRGMADHRRARGPYHIAKQSAGVPDTTGGGSSPRVVRPSCAHAIVYNNAKPANTNGRVVQDLQVEDIAARPVALSMLLPDMRPLIPGGARGAYQQGLLDPNPVAPGAGVLAEVPLYEMFDLQATGDELLIGCYRDTIPDHATWEFADYDRSISNFFGNGTGATYPDIGVYVMMGSAP
jgi:hypothetical protein